MERVPEAPGASGWDCQRPLRSRSRRDAGTSPPGPSCPGSQRAAAPGIANAFRLMAVLHRQCPPALPPGPLPPPFAEEKRPSAGRRGSNMAAPVPGPLSLSGSAPASEASEASEASSEARWSGARRSLGALGLPSAGFGDHNGRAGPSRARRGPPSAAATDPCEARRQAPSGPPQAAGSPRETHRSGGGPGPGPASARPIPGSGLPSGQPDPSGLQRRVAKVGAGRGVNSEGHVPRPGAGGVPRTSALGP